jgi:hypothetical protein
MDAPTPFFCELDPLLTKFIIVVIGVTYLQLNTLRNAIINTLTMISLALVLAIKGEQLLIISISSEILKVKQTILLSSILFARYHSLADLNVC